MSFFSRCWFSSIVDEIITFLSLLQYVQPEIQASGYRVNCVGGKLMRKLLNEIRVQVCVCVMCSEFNRIQD